MSICNPKSKELLQCPFCKEIDYDMKGLKLHLEYFCEVYGKVKAK